LGIGERSHVCRGSGQQLAVGPGDDARAGLRGGLVRTVRGECLAGGGHAVVIGDGVVDEVDIDRILQGDAASGKAGHVVDDHVVEEIHPVPWPRIVLTLVAVSRRCVVRIGNHVLPVDAGEADTAAVAGAGRVAFDQVGDHLDVAGSGLRASSPRGAPPPTKIPPPETVWAW
jgi:hypothetical protein